MTRAGWRAPRPEGYVDSIQIAGTLIAPILAGFAVTILALLLSAPGPEGSDPIRWREAVLAVLVTAALVLVSSAQAAITARASHVRPDELVLWHLWPGATPAELDDDSLDRLVARQRDLVRSTSRATSVCRHTYNVGTLLFFVAVALLLVPSGDPSGARQVVLAVATGTVAVELAWATATSVRTKAVGDRLPALVGPLAAYATAAAILISAPDDTASALAAAVVGVGVAGTAAAAAALLLAGPGRRSAAVGAGLVVAAVAAAAGAVLLFAGEREVGAPLAITAGALAVGLLAWAIRPRGTEPGRRAPGPD